MNSDCAFVTGKTHRVCQDYCRSGAAGDYVIVSDGCSSSPDSDFGARLLVKSVENNLISNGASDPKSAAFNSLAATRVLNLPETCLDATLLIANKGPLRMGGITEPHICVSTFGDGFVAAKLKNGSIKVIRIEYPSGYPNYISYILNKARQERLTAATGDNPAKVEEWLLTDKETTLVYAFPDAEIFPFTFFESEVDLVAVFSDGLNTFSDGEKEIPWATIVRELMNIPLPNGQFVQRQMNWLVKECAKRKWTFADDISMGAIHVPEDTQP